MQCIKNTQDSFQVFHGGFEPVKPLSKHETRLYDC